MLLLALRQLAPACHAEAASSIYGWAGQTQRGGLEALLARERHWTSDDVGLDEVSLQHPPLLGGGAESADNVGLVEVGQSIRLRSARASLRRVTGRPDDVGLDEVSQHPGD